MLLLPTVTLDIIQVTANCIVKTCNHDFQRNREMQHCCEIFFELAQHCSHIVALKIVVANRLV